MSESENNNEDIRANRLRIIELDTAVMNNKASVYQSRSMIEENRLMILSNYAAAFMGNRQLANHNTEQVLENRNSILRSFVAENDVEKDCILASFNKTSLDFLEHRSSLNTSVLEISEELAEINSRLIAVNEKIMKANESIVEFNNKQIDMNSELLDGALSPSKATSESNAELIRANSDAMDQLATKAAENSQRIHDVLNKSIENTAQLVENKKEINERRKSILENHERISKNRDSIYK